MPASTAFSEDEPITIERTAPRAVPWPASRRPVFAKVGFAALGVAAAVLATGYVLNSSRYETTDNAYIEGDVHPVSSRVAGDVAEVFVDDNAEVRCGQLLARLDARDFEIRVRTAEADLAKAAAGVAQAEAALLAAQAQSRQADANIASAEAQAARARLDFGRAEKLFDEANPVISKQEYDAFRAGCESASGAEGASRAAQEAASATVHSMEAGLASARANRELAQAALDNAKLQLSYTDIVAAADGHIAKKSVQTGQRVQPGQALMAVVSTDWWLVANFKENQLGRIRPGQTAEVSIDALPGRKLRGTVESLAPGTGSKFSLLPPDNATGNFLKVVQRVQVKIVFAQSEMGELCAHVRPGLSTEVAVLVQP